MIKSGNLGGECGVGNEIKHLNGDFENNDEWRKIVKINKSENFELNHNSDGNNKLVFIWDKK